MPWHFKGKKVIQVKSAYKVNSGQLARAGALISIDLDDEPEDLVLYAFYSGRKYPLEKVRVFLEYLQSALVKYGINQ